MQSQDVRNLQNMGRKCTEVVMVLYLKDGSDSDTMRLGSPRVGDGRGAHPVGRRAGVGSRPR